MRNPLQIRKRFVKALLILMVLISPSFGQNIKGQLRVADSSFVQVITTVDKSSNVGRIISVGDKEIVFKAEFGTIVIPIEKIKEIKEVPAAAIKQGIYWFPNPNATRLYFSPTAFMLNKREGYFADYYVFFPGFAYGITNNITIGGGLSLIPGANMSEQIYYFTPKIGLKAGEKFHVAAGALVIKLPNIKDESDEPPLAGILYGVSTFGHPDASLTFGLGYGFVDDELADKPLILIGGEKRLSRRIGFVSENFIFPGLDNPMVSYGIRFFGEKMSVDLALWNSLSHEAIFPGVPYIDFVYSF